MLSNRHVSNVIPGPVLDVIERRSTWTIELSRTRSVTMPDLARIPRDMPRAVPNMWAANRHVNAAPTSSGTPIVFIVDDDASVRESLELLVESAGWTSATFASASDFLASPRVVSPSCLVLDVALPDLNGLDLEERLADRSDLPIILLTGLGDVPMIVRAMKFGAVEFVMRPFATDVLVGAVERALERSRRALSDEAQMRELRERYASLSARERDVMALVASGLLNKQVGGELGISEITVKAHRGNVMRKMNAASFADLVRMADKLGIAATERAVRVQRSSPVPVGLGVPVVAR
jgi:FixJ family two-component response regulator